MKIYSNTDHKINKDTVKIIKNNPGLIGVHYAKNFNADVGFNGREWYAEIWRYGSLIETIKGKTALSVIKKANKKWGNE